MAFENVNVIGKVLWQFFRECDGHTRVSRAVNIFTVDVILVKSCLIFVIPKHFIIQLEIEFKICDRNP